MATQQLLPVAIRREGDGLQIDWNDGVRTFATFRHLRANCPCAGCKEDRGKPADPFRILKPNELVPLAPTAMPRVGRYAYRIVWSDGHDTGIYTLEHLRELSVAPK